MPPAPVSSTPVSPAEISDYALIGDCQTAALVDRKGCIDWLCWPRFDSDACFAAMLGDRSNGCWSIAPAEPFTVSRRYRPGTLTLETVFETAEGSVALIDFMAPGEGSSHVIRMVEGRRGRVAMRLELILRFGYGATVPWVTQMDDGALRAIAGPDMVMLRSPVATRGEDLTTVAEFSVDEGETVPFALSYQASHLPLLAPIEPHRALEQTEAFWRDWLAQGRVSDAYAEAVQRSLITLKALTFAQTGGVVAAPTTSLPEQIGGERNWGLSFLLDPRLHPDPALPDERGLL